MNIKPILRKYDFRPRKRWGQNFLINDKVRDKMIGFAGIKPADSVLEIGPGLGMLTEKIARQAKEVIAVEKDKKLCRILKDLLGNYSNLRIICNDILKIDLFSLVRGNKKLKVIGSLPYYITSPIIFRLLNAGKIIDVVLITVQKEVGRRLLAGPDTKDYASISLNIRYYSEPSLQSVIKKDAFFPRPKVDSSIIRLKMLKQPAVRVNDEQEFFRLVRASFNKRRKTILNSLAGSKCFNLTKQEWSDVFKKSRLDPLRRAESLKLEEFAGLFNNLKAGI
ncbi:MAG: 16S rRNA (adenine(1518)-N(6)/adenine(1519)-N(6))-dimethyltransferase RsmA [Candidatus Omnitrophota bacterium]|nr:16S rRNA (adenine(1518)-N(6)/adenine(1519)-N(6))-dimethyltransferase RsmA [Candidatus Omnitrophota bacterium]